MFAFHILLLLAIVLDISVLIHGASTPLEKDGVRIRSVTLSTPIEQVVIGTGGHEVGHDAAYARVMGIELGHREKRQYRYYGGYNRGYYGYRGGYRGYNRNYGGYRGGYPGYNSYGGYRNYGGYRGGYRSYGGYRGYSGGSSDDSKSYGGASVSGGIGGTGGYGQQIR